MIIYILICLLELLLGQIVLDAFVVRERIIYIQQIILAIYITHKLPSRNTLR